MTRPRPGQPPKAVKADCWLQVRLTQERKAAYEAKAEASGHTLSSLVITVLDHVSGYSGR